MKKLQQKKSPKFKLITRKGAYRIKGGTANNNGNNGPYPPPYEPGGNNDDSKGDNDNQ